MSFFIQGLETVGSGIQNFFGSFATDISKGFSNAVKGIGDIITEIINAIKTFIGDVENFFNRIASFFDNLGKAVVNGISEFWNILRIVVGDVTGFLKNLPNMIKTAFIDIYNFFVSIYNNIRNFIGNTIQEFINILSSFFGFVVKIMSYPFNYIRYLFNYALYHIITHSNNLVGGFLFGLAINELRKMKYKSMDNVMGNLLFIGIKYYMMDITVQGLFRLYAQRNKISKPIPPPIPTFEGIKI